MRSGSGSPNFERKSAGVNREAVGLKGDRGAILVSVMLSISLVAIDSTILATAIPAIVDDLGGFTQFPWLFSVYLLAQAVSVPAFGKLADVVGRKPVMLAGIGLFVIGSLLCGLAWSMTSLIIFRAIQGVGAGAIQPMGMTIVGDIYTLEERARVQGYVGSVWAASAVVGPTLGGAFADFLSWRWIFIINLPLGLVAAWVLWRQFKESIKAAERHRVDVAGTVVLTLGVGALLLGLLEGGLRWTWTSPASGSLFVGSGVLLLTFVLLQRRAHDPVLPLWIFGSRVLVSAILSSLVVGALMLGLSTYVPLYAQSVLGHEALTAGLALAAITLGWPVAATLSGRLYMTIGFQRTNLIGAVVASAGGASLLTIEPSSSIWHLAFAGLVMGLGFGLIVSPSVVAAQSAVTWHVRGVVTGSTLFARSLGSAIGVAAFGAIANATATERLGERQPMIEDLTPEVLHPAVHAVFVASALLSLALVATGLLMTRRITLVAPHGRVEAPSGPEVP